MVKVRSMSYRYTPGIDINQMLGLRLLVRIRSKVKGKG